MKVQKYEISRTIDKLKSIVQKNDQFPALGGVLVKDGYLIASNTEMTMQLKLEASKGSYFIIPMKAIDLMNSNRWIPVDERLPEPDKYIAISLDNCDIPAIGRYTVDNEGGGTFRVGNQDESFLEIGLFVNAWMPLPERYVEDKIMDVTIKFVKGGGVE